GPVETATAKESTGCIVAGAGPAGMMVAYLLARSGVKVTLLESHKDFQRKFRGDTLSPAILDLMDQLGLAEELLELPHAKATGLVWHMPGKEYHLLDYGSSSKKFPFMAVISQPRFLDFLAGKAAAFGTFDLRLGAKVSQLVRDDAGRVVGVSYRDGTGADHELLAPLVIGADGRFSKLRQLSGITTREVGVGNDLLWFQVPRFVDTDPWLCGFDLFSDGRGLGAVLNHDTNWQIGYAIPVGTVGAARERGVEPIRQFIKNTLPWLGERADALTDFNQLTLLSIRITQMDTWSIPGLVLIGDAAHVISPVGGYGIGLAIADAVEAANVLHPVLLAGAGESALDEACATIEARRRPVVEDRQAFQARLEARNNKVRARAMARLASGRPNKRGGPRPSREERIAGRFSLLRKWVGRRATLAVRMPVPILPTVPDRDLTTAST
ncbi:MAG TPA: FAD-dependent monooxygenase, partial [Candidatus Limnocylindrales bacterium]